jgi:toxin YoeB
MEIILMPTAMEDIEFWNKSGNLGIQKRISALLQSISAEPFAGIGKPEPLKYVLAGYWSRRINTEHRIVYACKDGKIYIVSCRYHYNKDRFVDIAQQIIATTENLNTNDIPL